VSQVTIQVIQFRSENDWIGRSTFGMNHRATGDDERCSVCTGAFTAFNHRAGLDRKRGLFAGTLWRYDEKIRIISRPGCIGIDNTGNGDVRRLQKGGATDQQGQPRANGMFHNHEFRQLLMLEKMWNRILKVFGHAQRIGTPHSITFVSKALPRIGECLFADRIQDVVDAQPRGPSMAKGLGDVEIKRRRRLFIDIRERAGGNHMKPLARHIIAQRKSGVPRHDKVGNVGIERVVGLSKQRALIVGVGD